MTALQEAQIAKLEAETEAVRFGIERSRARAVVADARAQLALERDQVAARIVDCQASEARVSSAKALRDEKLLLSQWQYRHVYNFSSGVDRSSVECCIDRLSQWEVTDPGCDITIIFNSPGGSVIFGMALFDYIRFMRGRGHKFTIIALGMAASMAGILLQAGDVRVMAKGSWLLIHEVSFSAGGKIGEVEDEYKFGQRLKEQAAEIFVERSGGKLTREYLEANWARKDWWLSGDEALALGLIDEVR